MRKKLSVLLVLVLILSLLAPGSFAGKQEVEPRAARNGDVIDIGPWLNFQAKDEALRAKMDKQIRQAAAKVNFDGEPAGDGGGAESAFTFDGGTKIFLGLDTELGVYYFKDYTLRSVGENVEIWVANDLGFHADVAPPDPLPDPRPDPVITQEQVDLLRDEYDSNIYPTDTAFFGMPNSHDGTYSLLEAWGYVPPGYYAPEDGIERHIILVDNVRDENYYDPDYPLFIAGFYSPTYEAYFDRNIITLDTNDWEERLETTFFGVTAHELQHLIHDDNDPAEETWLNEGMSDFAEFLCGYGHPESHVEWFLDYPENSLVDWDEHYDAPDGPETLADYGQAYLLQLYLFDQYGADFTRELATSPVSGFESVEETLAMFHEPIDFAEIFRRFSVAVAIDEPMVAGGIYGFDSIDLEYYGGLDFESALMYDKDGVPAWGGDYKVIETNPEMQGVLFDGTDFVYDPWIEVETSPDSGGPALYSGTGDEIDRALILPVDLTGVTEADLNFNTYYDLEDYWDYGFVQVSSDGGYTWTSLENAYTTDLHDPNAYPAIIDQLPGLTSWSPGWIPMSFDLDAYVGQEIHIAFRFMTDWATHYEGWYVKDIEIPGVELGIANGSLEGFVSIQELLQQYVEYQVVFVNRVGRSYQFFNLDPMNVTEMDGTKLRQMMKVGETFMIVWYPAPAGTKGYVDFSYEFLTREEMKALKKKK